MARKKKLPIPVAAPAVTPMVTIDRAEYLRLKKRCAALEMAFDVYSKGFKVLGLLSDLKDSTLHALQTNQVEQARLRMEQAGNLVESLCRYVDARQSALEEG